MKELKCTNTLLFLFSVSIKIEKKKLFHNDQTIEMAKSEKWQKIHKKSSGVHKILKAKF